MKLKIDFKVLFIFLLTILYFLKDIIIKDNFLLRDRMHLLLLMISSIVLIFIVILLELNKNSILKKFIIIAIFIGVQYIFITPFLGGTDEVDHFYRVYSFFMEEKTDEKFKVPRAIKKIVDNGKTYNSNLSYWSSKVDNKDFVVDEEIRLARAYTPLSYLQYLLPVWIFGFLIKSNIFVIITSTRICGFLLYLIASVFAIKTIPKRKEFIALFCLMPSIISSACTINADSLTNLSIIVFISVWYKLYYYKKQITKKDIILILFTGIIVGYSKIIYVFEFLLLFFLPKECFGGNNKKKVIQSGILISIIIFATLINVILTSKLLNNLYENMSLQKEFILSHPLKYSLILISNILENYDFFFSFTTNYTVLHNIFFPKQCVQLLYFIVLLMCILKEEVNLDLNKISKIIIGFIGLFIIVLSYTSVYIHWKEVKVGSKYVTGMQARYYIPVMLMYLIIISRKKAVIKINDNIPCFMALWVNFTILINIMMCVI